MKGDFLTDPWVVFLETDWKINTKKLINHSPKRSAQIKHPHSAHTHPIIIIFRQNIVSSILATKYPPTFPQPLPLANPHPFPTYPQTFPQPKSKSTNPQPFPTLYSFTKNSFLQPTKSTLQPNSSSNFLPNFQIHPPIPKCPIPQPQSTPPKANPYHYLFKTPSRGCFQPPQTYLPVYIPGVLQTTPRSNAPSQYPCPYTYIIFTGDALADPEGRSLAKQATSHSDAVHNPSPKAAYPQPTFPIPHFFISDVLSVLWK